MARIIKQAIAGVAVVVLVFVGSLFLCQYIPGALGKYLSPLGEVIVGCVIFVATLVLALYTRFNRWTLFLTAALIPLLLVGVMIVISGQVYLAGLCGDALFVSKHTALPVLISASLVFLIRTFSHSRPSTTSATLTRRTDGL
jgi:hypothetical protein